jgi:hypothetical protein
MSWRLDVKISKEKLRKMILQEMADYTYKRYGPGSMGLSDLRRDISRSDRSRGEPGDYRGRFAIERDPTGISTMGNNVLLYFKLLDEKDYYRPLIARAEKMYGEVFGFDVDARTISFIFRDTGETTTKHISELT